MDRTGYLGAIQKDPYKVEPSLIPYHPGSDSPGGLLFFERLLPSGIVFFQAFLGQVAWFFSGAGGLIFFKHWPTFFLTFAHCGQFAFRSKRFFDLVRS